MAQGYSVANLGITITSSANTAIRSVNSLTNSLIKANGASASLVNSMGALGVKSVANNASAQNYSNSLNNISKSANNANYSLQKMSGTMNNFGRIVMTSIGFGSLQQGLYTVINAGKNSLKEATDFIENYNLFNVSMKTSFGKDLQTQEEIANAFEKQVDFQDQLNRSFLTNQSETMRYQGFFQNLSSSLGISSQGAAILSQNLTKLTYDLSSLYNVDVSTIYSKLQSGIIGQTKPLRTLGIDVTMQTLQPILTELGIDRQVTSLTQAEKVMLRYISIVKQSTSAQGDFARTIETPANQMKIFAAQTQELTRWFGTLFIGMFGQVLPYINAFVISLKEIFKYMSLAFGFNVEDYDFLASQDEQASDLEDILNDTTNASEKLKKSLFGFDEINNLSTSATSGIDFGGTYDSGVYDELLGFLDDYNNGMEGITTKAQQIADSFLEWLGFSKDEEGKLSIIKGTLADIANMTFPVIAEFVSNMIMFVNDVVKVLADNPLAFVAFTAFLVYLNQGLYYGAISKGLLLISDPLTGIVGAVMLFGTYYDDIKQFFDAMTPDQSLISGLLLLAAAIGAVWIASTAGGAAATILTGLGTLFALTGVTALISASEGYKKSPSNYNTNEDALPGTGYTNTGGGYTGGNSNWDFTNQYASGGMPSVGEAFIARESGPELVGVIGGRSAVANNDQIVQAVSQGVYSAVVSANVSGQPMTVNVVIGDDVRLGSALIDNINRTTKVTGKSVLVR